MNVFYGRGGEKVFHQKKSSEEEDLREGLHSIHGRRPSKRSYMKVFYWKRHPWRSSMEKDKYFCETWPPWRSSVEKYLSGGLLRKTTTLNVLKVLHQKSPLWEKGQFVTKDLSGALLWKKAFLKHLYGKRPPWRSSVEKELPEGLIWKKISLWISTMEKNLSEGLLWKTTSL